MRSRCPAGEIKASSEMVELISAPSCPDLFRASTSVARQTRRDRKSTRLNSSHLVISYAVFCLKKKKSSDMRLMVAPLVHVLGLLLLKAATYSSIYEGCVVWMLI